MADIALIQIRCRDQATCGWHDRLPLAKVLETNAAGYPTGNFVRCPQCGGWLEEVPAGPPSEAPIWAAAAHAAAAGHLEPLERRGTVRPPSVDETDEGPAGPDGNIHFRIGVLDHDLINDPDAIIEHAVWVAGWYVHDCAALLERQAAKDATIADIYQQVRLANAELERLREELDLLRQVALLAPRPPWFKTDTTSYVRALDALDAHTTAQGDDGRDAPAPPPEAVATIDKLNADVVRLQHSEQQARSVIALHQQNGCGVQLQHEGLQVEAARARQLDPIIAELGPLLDGLRPTHARTGHAANAPCGWCRLIATYDTYDQARAATIDE